MLAALFALVIVTPPSFAESAPEAFERGLAAYQKHDWSAAREAFVAATKIEAPTARVLHNLALTHYQLNQKAMALGLWRKALAIDPNFAAARAGRDLLETRMRMRPFEGEGAMLRVRHALERVSPFLMSWALALVFTLFAWAGLRHWARVKRAADEDAERPGFPYGTAVFGLTTVIIGATLALRLSFDFDRRATIVTEKSEVRSLPSARAVALFEILGGFEVLVKRANEGWSQVQNYDGSTGWVPDSDLIVTSDI